MARPKKNKDTTTADIIEELCTFYDNYVGSEYPRVTKVGNYFGLLALGTQTIMTNRVAHMAILQQATYDTDLDTRIEAEHALIAHGYKILNGM